MADIIHACESMLATLAATEARLEWLAAQHLPFAAAARMHREAVLGAHDLLAAHGVEPTGLLTLAEVLISEDAPALRPRRHLSRGAGVVLAPPEAAVVEVEPVLVEIEPSARPEPEPALVEIEPSARPEPVLVEIEPDEDLDDVEPEYLVEIEPEPLDEEPIALDLPDDAIVTGAGGEDAPVAEIDGDPEVEVEVEDEVEVEVVVEVEDEDEDEDEDEVVLQLLKAEAELRAESGASTPVEEDEPLVRYEDDDLASLDEESVDPYDGPLVSFEEEPDSGLVFDDEEDRPDQPLVTFEAEDTLTQLEGLMSSDEPLVQFDDFDEDEDTQETGDEPAEPPPGGEPEPDAIVPDQSPSLDTYRIDPEEDVPEEEATLLADLEGLMRTRGASAPPDDDGPEPLPLDVDDLEFLEIGEAPAPGNDVEFQDESSVSEVIVAKPEDQPTLPPTPIAELMARESEEGPAAKGSPGRAAVRVTRPGKAATPRVAGRTDQPTYSPTSFETSVPTIRDGSQAKPRAAAIRVSPDQQSGMVVESDEELLEMGEADVEIEEEYLDDPSSEGSFRLNVEEYEEVEYVDEDEEDEAMRAPPPIPEFVGPTNEELQEMFRAAVTAREEGRMEDSVNLFSDVLDGDPENVDAHMGRGRVYLDLSDYARAMSDFTVAEELATDSAEPQVALGDFYFARKEYRRAIDFFNRALKMQSDHAMAYCRRGISHYYRKDYDKAVKDLTKAQKLDPEIPNIGTYLNTAKKRRKRG